MPFRLSQHCLTALNKKVALIRHQNFFCRGRELRAFAFQREERAHCLFSAIYGGSSCLDCACRGFFLDELTDFDEDFFLADPGPEAVFKRLSDGQPTLFSGSGPACVHFEAGLYPGSIQQLLGESLTFENTAAITGQFRVPGSPRLS